MDVTYKERVDNEEGVIHSHYVIIASPAETHFLRVALEDFCSQRGLAFETRMRCGRMAEQISQAAESRK